MYNYEIKPELQKILNKLFKKDRKTYEAVMNKINEKTKTLIFIFFGHHDEAYKR